MPSSPSNTTDSTLTDSNGAVHQEITHETSSPTQSHHDEQTTTPRKKAHFDIKEEEEKEVQEALSTKPTSSKKRTRRYKCKTCCGVISLNISRVITLVAMFINIASFIAIAIVVVNAFSLQSTTETDLLISRGDLIQFSMEADCNVQLSVYENRTAWVDSFYQYNENITQLLGKILPLLPSNAKEESGITNTSRPSYEQDVKILNMVIAGDISSALLELNSSSFQRYHQQWTHFLDTLQSYSTSTAFSKNDYLIVASAVNLAFVVLSLVVVVPVVLLVFAMMIKKEGKSSKQLKTTNAMMLMDTMEDEELKQLFKQFCLQESNTIYFSFLEKTLEYDKLSEQVTEYNNQLQKWKTSKQLQNNDPTFAEKMKDILYNQEKQKYELAFEIFSEYLDENVGETPILVSGDIHDKIRKDLDDFFLSQSKLPEDLFDQIQHEVAVSFSEFHYKFKQSVMYLKRMKQASKK